MKRIGARLVQERKLALSEGVSAGDVGEGREYGKDLLSLLVKANMTDPEASSMSDEDVQDRESPSHSNLAPVPHSYTTPITPNKKFHPHTEIATFIVAGHETSSAGIAWCLHCLSNNLEAQRASPWRNLPSWHRFARCGADQVPQVPGPRRERGTEAIPSHSIHFEGRYEGRHNPAL
jgi:hypothetical protein